MPCVTRTPAPRSSPVVSSSTLPSSSRIDVPVVSSTKTSANAPPRRRAATRTSSTRARSSMAAMLTGGTVSARGGGHHAETERIDGEAGADGDGPRDGGRAARDGMRARRTRLRGPSRSHRRCRSRSATPRRRRSTPKPRAGSRWAAPRSRSPERSPRSATYPALGLPALWVPPPAEFAMTWTGAGDSAMTLSGESFTAQQPTSSDRVLSFSVPGDGRSAGVPVGSRRVPRHDLACACPIAWGARSCARPSRAPPPTARR